MFDGLLFGFIDNGVLAICALLVLFAWLSPNCSIPELETIANVSRHALGDMNIEGFGNSAYAF